MAKRKKDDGGLTIILAAIGSVFFVIFLINSFIVNLYYSQKLSMSNASIRVTDSGNIIRFAPYIFSLTLLAGMAVFMMHGAPPAIRLLAILALFIALIAMFALSARIGTTQIGMLIFKNKGTFIIPTDPNKNTFSQNIFQFQLVKDMFKMEELPLNGIYKITREYGKKAFIHGTFGTRQVAWRDKQKRDECISALERATGKKLSSIDLGK